MPSLRTRRCSLFPLGWDTSSGAPALTGEGYPSSPFGPRGGRNSTKAKKSFERATSAELWGERSDCEIGLLRLADAQVRSLRADNSAADTCLRTNSSSSLRWECGASMQFGCVFPVIRSEILCSASRSKKRMVFLVVAPSR